MAGNPAASFDHFPHTRPATGAQVVKRARWRLERENVRISQIANVNVIANAGTVGRVVIRSENFDVFFLSERDLRSAGTSADR